MNGLLIVNKPEGFTSFDCVALLRRLTGERHIGHTGTLDPNATGVLPICLGSACRLIEFMDFPPKSYRVRARFGYRSDTLDVWGTVQPGDLTAFPDRESLLSAAKGFVGEIEQIPPMYAAVKVNGKRLYQYAREGKTVELQPRRVTVYAFDLISYDPGEGVFVADISCSRGTYIRSITRDLGETFGCGCIMTGLVRTSAAGYGLEDCVGMEELRTKSPEEIESLLLPFETAVSGLPQLPLEPGAAALFLNGNPSFSRGIEPAFVPDGDLACFSDGTLLGIARKENGIIKAYKVFHS